MVWGLALPGGGEALTPAGIAAAIPEGCVGVLAVRSSMGIRHGVAMSNGIGVIDSDYRGPLRVGLHNFRDTEYVVEPGDRIAQLLILPVLRPEVEVVSELSETARGAGGFGSPGR